MKFKSLAQARKHMLDSGFTWTGKWWENANMNGPDSCLMIWKGNDGLYGLFAA